MSNKLVPAVKISRGNPVPAVKVGGKNKNMPHVIPQGKSLIEVHQDDDDPFQNDYLSVTKPITPIHLPQNLLELGLVDKTYIKIEYYNNSNKNMVKYSTFSISDNYEWVAENMGVDFADDVSMYWDPNDDRTGGNGIARLDK